MIARYRWINQSKILRAFADSALPRNFIGKTKQLVSSVNFYCDRTNLESHVYLPAFLTLPPMDRSDSWQNISQQRAQDLERILKTNPLKRCLIMWSGGVDSTFILCCIIRYVDPAIWDRFIIGLSSASLWENPYFYRDQIRPRFPNIQDVEHVSIDPDHLIVSGNVADKIICPELLLQWLIEHPGQQRLDQRSHDLIQYLVRYLQDENKAITLYHHTLESAKRWNVDIITAGDFLWWLNFNFVFVGMYYHVWGRPWSNHHTVEDIENRFHWFVDHRYQLWAMNQPGRWHDVDADWHLLYKKDLKDFIYSVDQNQYYRDFKQKIRSNVPLADSWAKIAPAQDWVLAVDSVGNKYYTTNQDLKQNLEQLGIS